MSYFTEEFLGFFEELRTFNDRDWFHENKKRYEAVVKEPFMQFVEELIFRLQEFDSNIDTTAKNAIFRINRDVRFTKDKSPYKTHVGASMNGGARAQKNMPGYYIHLSSDKLSLGGGAHFLDKDGIYSIRNAIKEDMNGFKSILKAKEFAKTFTTLQGDKNKRLPEEFRDLVDDQPLIANKKFYYTMNLESGLVLDDKFMDHIVDYYKIGHTVNEFLYNALDRF